MNNLGDSKRGYFGVGSESAPSQTFSNEPVTGIYLDTPGSSSAWTVSKRGTKRLRIDDDKTVFTGPVYASGGIIPTGPFLAGDGSFSAPSYSFSSETAMGMYRDSPDFLAITNGTGTEPSVTFNPSGTVVRGALTTGTGSISGGSVIAGNLSVLGTSSFTNTASFGSFGITSAGLIQGADGTISAPEYSFTNDTKMGMYRGGTNILNFTPGTGTLPMLSVGTSGIAVSGAITTGTNSISGGLVQVSSGTVASPSFSFSSSPTTGFSYDVSGTRSFLQTSVGGSVKFSVQSDLIGGNVPLSVGSNALTCGALTSASITNSGTSSFSGNMTCGAMTTGALTSSTAKFQKLVSTVSTNATATATTVGNVFVTLVNPASPATYTINTNLSGMCMEFAIGQALTNSWTISLGSSLMLIRAYCKDGTTYAFSPGTTFQNIVFPAGTTVIGDHVRMTSVVTNWFVELFTASNYCTFS